MQRKMLLLAMVAFVLPATAFPTSAQDGADDRTRCAILGPMSVSAWFGVLENSNRGDRERNRDAIATLESAVSLYKGIGCPGPALEATLDCLTAMAIDGEISDGPGPAAEVCMAEAGLPRP